MPDRGSVQKAVIGIALTGVALGLAWLAMATAAAVAIGRASRIADQREPGCTAGPEPVAGPLLGVVLPRESSFLS